MKISMSDAAGRAERLTTEIDEAQREIEGAQMRAEQLAARHIQLRDALRLCDSADEAGAARIRDEISRVEEEYNEAQAKIARAEEERERLDNEAASVRQAADEYLQQAALNLKKAQEAANSSPYGRAAIGKFASSVEANQQRAQRVLSMLGSTPASSGAGVLGGFVSGDNLASSLNGAQGASFGIRKLGGTETRVEKKDVTNEPNTVGEAAPSTNINSANWEKFAEEFGTPTISDWESLKQLGPFGRTGQSSETSLVANVEDRSMHDANNSPTSLVMKLGSGPSLAEYKELHSEGDRVVAEMNLGLYTEKTLESELLPEGGPLVWLNASEVCGVMENDDTPSETFWRHHNNSREKYGELAVGIDEIGTRIHNGESLDQVLSDDKLRRCWSVFQSEPIRVSEFNGRYVFEGNGRHRIRMAEELGLSVPVRVVSRIKAKGA